MILALKDRDESLLFIDTKKVPTVIYDVTITFYGVKILLFDEAPSNM